MTNDDVHRCGKCGRPTGIGAPHICYPDKKKCRRHTMDEVKIDEKYSIRIINNGEKVILLRDGEVWSEPIESKAWISVFYKLKEIV